MSLRYLRTNPDILVWDVFGRYYSATRLRDSTEVISSGQLSGTLTSVDALLSAGPTSHPYLILFEDGDWMIVSSAQDPGTQVDYMKVLASNLTGEKHFIDSLHEIALPKKLRDPEDEVIIFGSHRLLNFDPEVLGRLEEIMDRDQSFGTATRTVEDLVMDRRVTKIYFAGEITTPSPRRTPRPRTMIPSPPAITSVQPSPPIVTTGIPGTIPTVTPMLSLPPVVRTPITSQIPPTVTPSTISLPTVTLPSVTSRTTLPSITPRVTRRTTPLPTPSVTQPFRVGDVTVVPFSYLGSQILPEHISLTYIDESLQYLAGPPNTKNKIVTLALANEQLVAVKAIYDPESEQLFPPMQ